jgi:chorismate synthase
MPGNSFGQAFRLTTWGESHGPAVGCTLDGCPAGLPLAVEDIQRELDRRRVGQSKVSSQRQEPDQVQILSGVFEGRTTGTPISMLVFNADAKSGHYENIRELYRPGHADYTWDAKYGFRDHRGGGRSSARETIGRVAGGAVAKLLLARAGVGIVAYTLQLGDDLRARVIDEAEIERNIMRCPDAEVAALMVERVDRARRDLDSLGGIVEVRARGVPPGLGEPVFDKLQADIGKAMFSIPAIKGVEMGEGFGVVGLRGSENNDTFVPRDGGIGTATNRHGGILGGISTGEEIVVRLAAKPPASIARPQQTVDRAGNPATIEVHGRHDPTVLPRLVPIAEAMLALVLADHLLRQRTARVD